MQLAVEQNAPLSYDKEPPTFDVGVPSVNCVDGRHRPWPSGTQLTGSWGDGGAGGAAGGADGDGGGGEGGSGGGRGGEGDAGGQLEMRLVFELKTSHRQ